MTTYDVRWACDVLRPVYDASDGVDGRVSIEVDPRLAHDTEHDHRRGQGAVVAGRPAQPVHQDPGHPGGPARRSPTRSPRGISVNVTLIFSLERYDEVMDAFLPAWSGPGPTATTWRGWARWRRSSSPASTPRSTSGWTRSAARRPRRCAARRPSPTRGSPTSATRRCSARDRWKALAAAGAKPQRPLWASTGVKDPAYDDTMYVDRAGRARRGQHDAGGDPGRGRRPRRRSAATPSRPMYAEAQQVLDDLAAAGIDYDDVVQVLEDEGVEKFEDVVERADQVRTSELAEGCRRRRRPSDASCRSRPPTRRSAAAVLRRSRRGRTAAAALAAPAGRQGRDAVGPGGRARGGDPARLAGPAASPPGAAARLRALRDELRAERHRPGRAGRHGRLVARARGHLPHRRRRADRARHHRPATRSRAALADRLDRTVSWWSAPSPAARWRPTATAARSSRRSRDAGHRPGRGRRIVVVTDPGSPLEQTARGGRLPRGLPGRPQRRRPLQRADRVRAGAGGAGRGRRGAAARPGRGARAGARRRPRTTRRSSSARRSARPRRPAATSWSSPTPAPASSASATGPSSWSPSRPASTARGLLPVVVEGTDAPGLRRRRPDAHRRRARAGAAPGLDGTAVSRAARARSSCVWEYATAVAGRVLGINPFDQPNVPESKDNTNADPREAGDGPLPEGEPALRRRRGRGVRRPRRCSARRRPSRASLRRAAGAVARPRLPRRDGLPRPARRRRGRASCGRGWPGRLGAAGHVRLGAAVPALDRPVPQGRSAGRCLPADHRRRPRRPRRAGPAVHLRPAAAGPGARRPAGARRARPARATAAPAPTVPPGSAAARRRDAASRA